MLIQKIKISNFKTYLSLDLDLTVDDDRPIILIGGSNGVSVSAILHFKN